MGAKNRAVVSGLIAIRFSGATRVCSSTSRQLVTVAAHRKNAAPAGGRSLRYRLGHGIKYHSAIFAAKAAAPKDDLPWSEGWIYRGANGMKLEGGCGGLVSSGAEDR